MGIVLFDLCCVVLGWYGGYFEYELFLWDYVVGCLIVEEVGGKFIDCCGFFLVFGKLSVLVIN